MNRKRSAIIFGGLCLLATLFFESCTNLNNTENEKLIIAFIDSACSIKSYKKHLSVLWNNEKEIAGNLVDDDKNGYVDDINGWNYDTDEGNIFTEMNSNHCDYVLQAFSDTLAEISKNVNYEIMVLDVLGIEGECSVSDLVRAIKYAEENGAQICNLSLSTYNDKMELKEVIEKSSMLFVAAAGNESEDLDEGFRSYPTNYKLKNIISVAAVDENNELLETSNYGEKTVDTAMNGILQYDSDIVKGTSIAAGRVTAVIAALYHEANAIHNIPNNKEIILALMDK